MVQNITFDHWYIRQLSQINLNLIHVHVMVFRNDNLLCPGGLCLLIKDTAVYNITDTVNGAFQADAVICGEHSDDSNSVIGQGINYSRLTPFYFYLLYLHLPVKSYVSRVSVVISRVSIVITLVSVVISRVSVVITRVSVVISRGCNTILRIEL